MTTLIVGCGYLGRRVGRLLADRGETRLRDDATEPTGPTSWPRWGIEPVLADVLDPASLAGLPEADRVLYCVGFDRSAGVPMRTVYVDGLRNALERLLDRAGRGSSTPARRASTARTTAAGSTRTRRPSPTTESGRVCLDAETAGRGRRRGAGSTSVVVRFSGLYGPGRIMRRAALERGEPIAATPTKWLNLIHIDDAAAAAVAALDRGDPGRVYLATDDRPVERRRVLHPGRRRPLGARRPGSSPPEPGSPEAAPRGVEQAGLERPDQGRTRRSRSPIPTSRRASRRRSTSESADGRRDRSGSAVHGSVAIGLKPCMNGRRAVRASGRASVRRTDRSRWSTPLRESSHGEFVDGTGR